jgi:hypothetical protein
MPVVRFSAKCALLGHKVDHTRIARNSCTPCARCSAAILDRGPAASRVAHTLSCFFGWHHYVAIGKRAQHNEYICEKCGHPLLLESGSDPHSNHHKFKKKVDYVCGLLGHRVHVVKKGSTATEYACRCGHPFVKAQADLKIIRHPLKCVVLGHYVTVNDTRDAWAEYVCLRCGHPFCFKLSAYEPEPTLESNLEQPLMRRDVALAAAAFALVSCIFFLWMFFAAATLERTADLGWISVSGSRDARAIAYEFAARWRHGMSGNSPLYMPGFFAVALASWFWCDKKSLLRMLLEGFTLLAVAAVCAAVLARYAAPRIVSDFSEQAGVSISRFSTAGTGIAWAQGIYSLLTWTTVIIASRWSIKLRSPKPLLIPFVLNLILAFVRPWTVADLTSQWLNEALDGEPTAVISLLLVPILSAFLGWVELRKRALTRSALPTRSATSSHSSTLRDS